MKKRLTAVAFAVAVCATLSARAALTVTATNGVESLTLAFDAAADARELWVPLSSVGFGVLLACEPAEEIRGLVIQRVRNQMMTDARFHT